MKLLETQGRMAGQKKKLLTNINKDKMTHICGHKALKWEHFMSCVKPAGNTGVIVKRNLKGWRIEGLTPFNRNVLW
jgi:hypothetical protein